MRARQAPDGLGAAGLDWYRREVEAAVAELPGCPRSGRCTQAGMVRWSRKRKPGLCWWTQLIRLWCGGTGRRWMLRGWRGSVPGSGRRCYG